MGAAAQIIVFVIAIVGVPPAMAFLLRRMTRQIVGCPRCGAIIGADMRRAVPRRITFWATNVAGALMFLTSFLPCIIGLMSVTGATADAYARPQWYISAFALALVMFFVGLKIVSRALRYPVTHCTQCGYRPAT